MVEEMVKNIRWLGHDGFLITAGGKVIVIDPYNAEEARPADLILITHEHFDHCSPEDVQKFQKPGTVILTEPQAAAKLTGDVRAMAPGDTVTVDNVTVTGVPAYNTDKPFHPKDNQWLGFIISVDGVTIYHAGDTDHIPEMEGLGVDIALLPVSGTYVMTWEQAVEAARKIQPKIAIPMHFAAIVGTSEDAERFAEALDGEIKVEVPVL